MQTHTSNNARDEILPGPRYIATYLLALPVIVVALASTGRAQLVGGLIAVFWLVLSPVALYARWAALLLPVASAVFLVLSVVLLDFNSAAFVVDVTIAAAMALVSFPRRVPRQMTPAEGAP
jgi:hypothetical protein